MMLSAYRHYFLESCISFTRKTPHISRATHLLIQTLHAMLTRWHGRWDKYAVNNCQWMFVQEKSVNYINNLIFCSFSIFLLCLGATWNVVQYILKYLKVFHENEFDISRYFKTLKIRTRAKLSNLNI